MKLDFAVLGTALCIVLLASGCDRAERGPVKSASQYPTPSQGPRTDVGQLPSQQPVQPDSSKESQPPVQGQADAREGAQRQHFDKKS